MLSNSDTDVHFNLRLQGLLHFFFQSSEHEGPQNFMKLADDSLVPFFFLLRCLLFVALLVLPSAEVEPLIKIFRGGEDVGKEEIKQTPELVEVVLKRGASQKESIVRVQLTETLRDNTFLILDLVGFIDYDVLPLPLFERTHADSDTFKGSEADIELARLDDIANDILTFALGANQVAEIDLREPLFELELPVGNDSLGANDEMLSLDVLEFT